MTNRLMFCPDGLDPTSHSTVLASLQQRGYTLATNALTLSAPTVTGSVRKLKFSTTFGGQPSYIDLPVSGVTTTTVRFGFRYSATTGNGTFAPLSLFEGATMHINSWLNTDGSISIARNGTQLGRSDAGSIPLNGSEFFIEFDIKIDSSTGWVKAYLNGSSTPMTGLNLTGQNTRNGGTTGIPSLLRLGWSTSPSGTDQTFRDGYLNDTAGSVNTGLWGDTSIARILPNTDDSVALTRSTGSTNYGIAGKTPWDTASNLSSATASTVDQYGLSDLSGTPASIYAVRTNVLADKSDAGARSVRMGLNSGGTTSNGTTQAVSTSPTLYTDLWEVDPNTSAAWTASGVNALKARVEVI